MKKLSLKLSISVISFIAIFLMANSSFAVVTVFESKPDTVVTLQSDGHIDEWTGLWELLPKNITNDTSVGVTFCRQKHQALRFTPKEAIALNGYKTNTIVAHSEMHSYGEHDVPSAYARENVITNIKNELQSKLSDVGWGAVEVGTGDLAEYGIGGYRYTAIQEGDNIVATSDAYSKTPKYVGQGAEAVRKNDVAYILTSGAYFNPITRFGLKQGNYAGAVSDTASGESNALLIQDAIWASSYNEAASDGINYKRVKPQIALDLVAEAEDYARYVSKLENYKATFMETNPKVIANTTAEKYSIGPLKIDYPDDTRFSYIQDIYLVDGNGNKVDTKYFTVVTTSGNAYPASGESFFIEFDRSVGDRYTRINVKAEFAYLSLTYAEIERYVGTGEIAQIVGILETSTDRHVYKEIPHPAEYDAFGKETKKAWTDYKYCTRTYYTGRFEEKVIGAYDPQDLFDVLYVKREWVEDYSTTYADRETTPPPTVTPPPSKNPPPDIDLTTSLGGYVWEDVGEGKEGTLNGLFDSQERKVPNVIVNLYEKGGKYLAQTKTDANGEYRFYGLNPMNKYYVEFIYNGMYYEPTNYTSPLDNTNGWGKGTWQNNSNATEINDKRDILNSRFAYIGSSPENYDYGEGKIGKRTYTKQELINAKVIDEFGNLINTDSEMAKYVLDCQIVAHTGKDTGYDDYLVPDVFVIDNEARVKNAYGSMYNMREEANKVTILFPDAYYINLGLHPRQDTDIAIKKDIQKVDVEINGQSHTYTYDTLEKKPDADGTWEIGVRISDGYYNTNYSRELYKSDFMYKISNYGDKALELGKTKEDELNVYVTYKIMVRNQSSSIKTSIEELVDYFDTDYTLDYDGDGTLDTSRSYIEIVKGEGKGKYPIKLSTESKYGVGTKYSISEYDRVYISGLEGKYLDAGQMAYFYVTFKVRKQPAYDEDWIILDEDISTGAIGTGKENIVELNGYSTKYRDGVVVPNREKLPEYAGIIDRDSNPGNVTSSDVNTFEDDTDKAPNMRLKLYKDDEANRVIVGSAWEDIRDMKAGLATIGNGEYEANKDILINGVTVELVELMNNGTEFVWRTTETGPETNVKPIINGHINDDESIIKDYSFDEKATLDGLYVFKSFVPGKYVVRFTYGDTEKTVITKSLAEINKIDASKYNEKSYNGQDYKTTTYQKGIEQNNSYDWREKSDWQNGDEILGKVITTVSTFKADASNNEPVVNVAEKKLQGEIGYLYDITASSANANASDAKDIESRRNAVNSYSDKNVTNYVAEVLASHKADYETMNDRNTLLKDLMQNTFMTAETGLVVVEVEYDRTSTDNQEVDNKTAYKIENVSLGLEERPKAQLAINKNVKNVKVTLADNSIIFDAQGPDKNLLWKAHKDYEIAYNNNLLDITPLGDVRLDRAMNAGLIQATMDEELMHGATIKIDYDITITNVGEVDYADNKFYYMGIEASEDKIVKTTPNRVLDYISNNINFSAEDNEAWKVISIDDIKKDGLVNANLIDDKTKEGEKDGVIYNYNTIIVAELKDELEPKIFSENNSVTVPLTLTQLLTSENNSEDLTYRNIVEIVETSNTVGRRNEYSVVGNQDPTMVPQELDSDLAEVVRILPPFGNGGIYIIISIIIITSVAIAGVGILFIKKKVLTK